MRAVCGSDAGTDIIQLSLKQTVGTWTTPLIGSYGFCEVESGYAECLSEFVP
jgi:hypothetical protein